MTVRSPVALNDSVERLNGSSKRKLIIAVEGAIQVMTKQSMTSVHFDCLKSVQN
jgi:hypothetical protein